MTKDSSAGFELIDRALAIRLLPKRDELAHKWGVGGLLIVGGAPGYIGAPALAAMAAGRSGAGIVNLAIPRSSVGSTATLVPEAVFLPLPESDFSHDVQSAIELIAPVAGKCHAMVVGPGLSRDEAATALMGALIGDTNRGGHRSLGFGVAKQGTTKQPEVALLGQSTPAVVDADALHWLADHVSWVEQVKPFTLLLTPHAGEFEALTGIPMNDILADPAGVAKNAAKTWQQTVVLKAGRVWISDGTVVRSNKSGVPALATAGSGDVLAGSIGAFLAQGLAPVDAATLAVYAGTEAADRLATELSTLGVVAGDLPRTIAMVLAELETESGAN